MWQNDMHDISAANIRNSMVPASWLIGANWVVIGIEQCQLVLIWTKWVLIGVYHSSDWC